MSKLLSSVVGLVLLGVLAVNLPGQAQVSSDPQQWLKERYAEAISLKVGMSRADLLRVFEQDGGLQRIPAGRYVLRSCRLVKLDVEFDVEYGRAYQERPAEEIKIKQLSKPYLEYANTD